MPKLFSIWPEWREELSSFEARRPFTLRVIPGKNMIYIQEGSVNLSVISESGKEAVVAILGRMVQKLS